MTTDAYSVLALLTEKGNGLIKGREIGARCGIKPVEVRAAINVLRSNGYPVCATAGGYYMSHDAREVRKTIHSMEHRMQAMEHAVNGLYKALGEMEVFANE